MDVTPAGMARDPEWLRGLATASGLHIVMGAGWYRTAYYPVEALIDRRSVDDLADEIVREATDGVGETGIKPGIIGEIGTDKPWVSPSEERVHRAAARASRRTGPGHHDPRASCPPSGSPSSGSSRRKAPTRAGWSSATPTRIRTLTTTSRSSVAARTSSSTSWA